MTRASIILSSGRAAKCSFSFCEIWTLCASIKRTAAVREWQPLHWSE
eukprot:CAMPEP_0175705196 /NCGR_PEP_ID=MMETSP0097-20121207/37413_1 /TAXON_ID=311494 /ORGANISM="Alexandrium monilatum, Strain CCMP3105" /LENGTH=46 /DNA_ID= /DNA_START= /DNA_END= /DNA_ORIENTATION=